MLPIEAGVRAFLGMLLVASPLLDLNTSPYHLLGIVLMATGVAGYCPLKALARQVGAQRPSPPARSAAAHG
jgi:hypothetical protein